MPAAEKKLIQRALAGETRAVRDMVALLTPVIQVRAARALTSRAQLSGRSIRQEVEDMTQEVFAALFDQDGRALRAWDPDRGLSFKNFVGLLAQRQVASIMRSGKRSPWREDPADNDIVASLPQAEPGPELRALSRQLLVSLLERLRERLSPRGLELFERLIVQQEPIAELSRRTGMSAEALYAWRSRLLRQARQLAAEIETEMQVESGPVSEDVGSPRIPTRHESR